MRGSADTIAVIADSQSWFETSAARNVQKTPEQTALVATTMAKFEALVTALEGNKNPTSLELQRYIDRGKELARTRAYILPVTELTAEAHEAVADMHNWSVPSTVVEDLVRNVVPLVEGDEPHARAALRSLFETYDYWDTYVEIHARTMRMYAIVMLFIMLSALAGGVILLHVTHIYSGVFCAGVAGALLSIIAKMPPLMGVGETNSYQLRIFSRLGIGVAASLIGMGLLCADVITIKLPAGTVAEMLNVDAGDTTSGSGVGSGSDTGSTTVQAGSAVPIDAGPAPDAGSALDLGSAGSVAARTRPEISAPVAQCTNEPGCEHQPRKKHLQQSTVLILMALAMLFAFSERALATFEDAVFPRVSVPKVPKPSAPKGGSSGGTSPGDAPPAIGMTPAGGASPTGGAVAGGGVVADAPANAPTATVQSTT